MNQSGFPGCCGIYVVSGFPHDAHGMFQAPLDPGELQRLEVPQALTLAALTSTQLGAQAELEAAGYVAVGRSSGIHANGTAITLFAKGLSPIEKARPKKVRVVKIKKSGRKK